MNQSHSMPDQQKLVSSLGHLRWLIDSRNANQKASLELLRLFNDRSETIINSKDLSQTANILLGVCFSLWRAAFLADSNGKPLKRQDVFKHAKTFLANIIENNSIGYSQDREARHWTFSYYVKNATLGLCRLPQEWQIKEKYLPATATRPKGATNAQRNWHRNQKALEAALKLFEADLTRKG